MGIADWNWVRWGDWIQVKSVFSSSYRSLWPCYSELWFHPLCYMKHLEYSGPKDVTLILCWNNDIHRSPSIENPSCWYRQSHKAAFDKSDLFFLCVLRPCTFTINKQDSEVLDAKVYVVIRECSFLTRMGMFKSMLDRYIGKCMLTIINIKNGVKLKNILFVHTKIVLPVKYSYLIGISW